MAIEIGTGIRSPWRSRRGRLAEEFGEGRDVFRAANNVVVCAGGRDRPDRRFRTEHFPDALVDDGRADLELERDRAACPVRPMEVILGRRRRRIPLPAFRIARELPHVGGRDVGDKAAEFEQQRDWRESEHGEAPDLLAFHPAADLLSEDGPQIPHVGGPVVGIVVAEIKRDEVEVNLAVVERIALRDHRPFDGTLLDGTFVAADLGGLADDMAAEALIDPPMRIAKFDLPTLRLRSMIFAAPAR
jgi:hypothetical protein